MREIKVNGIYKHFKGKYIKVICLGLDAETKEEMVAIEELEESQGYPKGQIWFRKIVDFLSEVDHEKYPNVEQKYRFELQEIESVANKFNK